MKYVVIIYLVWIIIGLFYVYEDIGKDAPKYWLRLLLAALIWPLFWFERNIIIK